MGKHFDSLADLLSGKIKQYEKAQHIGYIHPYLTQLVENAALFEFPLKSDNIRPQTGKEEDEYNQYIRDYMDLSRQYGKCLLTPFDVTAIEDLDGVVVLDPRGGNSFSVVSCIHMNLEENKGSIDNLVSMYLGEATIDGLTEQNHWQISSEVSHFSQWLNGIRIGDGHLMRDLMDYGRYDLATAVATFIEEVAYIMDPENFIMRVESRGSMRADRMARQAQGKHRASKMARKTVMRPRYIFMDEEETRSFLTEKSRGAKVPHTVRGYTKTLMSEKFTHMRGQKLYIAQYMRGEGRITGKDGLIYQVMVKEAPDKLVDFST